jgi:hypothetical protein
LASLNKLLVLYISLHGLPAWYKMVVTPVNLVVTPKIRDWIN